MDDEEECADDGDIIPREGGDLSGGYACKLIEDASKARVEDCEEEDLCSERVSFRGGAFDKISGVGGASMSTRLRARMVSSSSSSDSGSRNSGSCTASSVPRTSLVLEDEALTIESMSQNWRTFMIIGKIPITLSSIRVNTRV